MSRLRRNRHPCFGNQLLRRLVQADHRDRWIVRPVIEFQYIFHAGYESGVGVRRDDPLLPKVRLERDFFSSARSYCRWRGQRCSAPPPLLPAASATTARDPWAVPNRPERSAWLQRLHRRCAAWPRLVNASRVSANSGPSSTSCWRVRATVSILVSRAAAIWLSLQASPASDARQPSANARLQQLARRPLAGLHQRAKSLTFLGTQLHNILLHGRLFRGHDASPALAGHINSDSDRKINDVGH